jgi:hypothetical protein
MLLSYTLEREMDKACHPLKDTRDFHRTACHPLKCRGRNSENDPVARVSQVHHNEPRLLRLSLPGGRGQGREGEDQGEGETVAPSRNKPASAS